MAFVGNKQINNVDVEIHANQYGGWQIREVSDDEEGKGETLATHTDNLDAAVAKARQELNKRKVKVAVHFITQGGQRGVAHGFHSRNKTVLARVNDEAESYDYGAARHVFKEDTPMEKVERFIQLGNEIKERQAEKNTIAKEYEFDLMPAVKRAIDEAIEAKGKPLARAKR